MTDAEEVYRAYSGEVHRFACWLSGDPNEADDIVSETFLRLWGSQDEPEVTTLKAYVLAIARNVYLRRRQRSSRYAQLSAGLADASPPPDVAAERRDEAETLLAAAQGLPEGERAALLMRIQHDLPYEEIARALGISLSAAKVRVHRARVKLNALREAIGGRP